MKASVRIAATVVTTLALAGAARGASPGASRASIVGTWQVVEWWMADPKSGERQYPLGRQPAGFYVYDASGHVFVQVSRPSGDRLGEGRWRALPADELRRLLDRYVSYYGTYSADPVRGIVSEHIDDDVTREHAGTERQVPYRIDGDRLLLGDGRSWQCVLMRVY